MRLKLGLSLGSGTDGVVFNPSNLSPAAWWDFSDASLLFTDAGTTPVSSDGDIIYQANDRTANGNDIVQSTLAARPIYKTGIQNGLSIGRFDGVDDFLNGGDILPLDTDNVAIFSAVKMSSDTTQYVAGKSRFAGSDGRYSLVKDTNMTSLYQNAEGTQSAGRAFSDTGYNVLSIVLNRSDGTNRVYDGSLFTEKTFTPESTDYTDTWDFFVGAIQSGVGTIPPSAGYYLDGDVGEIVVIKQPGTITDTNISDMVGFLETKWGL